jgi:Tfp pilus assembly protein PilF
MPYFQIVARCIVAYCTRPVSDLERDSVPMDGLRSQRPLPGLSPVKTGLVGAVVALAALTACSGSSGGTDKNASAATLLAAGIKAETQGDNNGARQLFQQVLAKEPGNLYAHYNLGVIAQAEQDNPTALQEYGVALATNPSYVPALFNEATIYAATNPTLAVATYHQVIKLQPHAPTAYLNLGLLEAQLGQTAQAVRDLSTAIHQDPTLAKSLPKKLLNKVGKAATQSPSSTPSPSASA